MLIPVILLSVVLGSAAKVQAPAKVDRIEVNTYALDHGGGIEQVLFWDWSPDYARHHCQGWVLADSCTIRKSGERYIVTLRTGQQVEAPILTYSRTDYDPERRNQELWPSKYRRKLW